MARAIPRETIAGLVLIGGRSARMARDKVTMELAGIPLWGHAVRILEPFVAQIVFIGANDEFRPPESYRVVPDDPPGYGPLGGIVTGLEQSGLEHLLVLAVDYPLVQPGLLDQILTKADGVWAVCGRSAEFLEPLVAYYDARCAPVIRQMLAEDEIRTHRLFDRVPSVVLTDEEFDRVDPQRLSQININTPAEWERAERILAASAT